MRHVETFCWALSRSTIGVERSVLQVHGSQLFVENHMKPRCLSSNHGILVQGDEDEDLFQVLKGGRDGTSPLRMIDSQKSSLVKHHYT